MDPNEQRAKAKTKQIFTSPLISGPGAPTDCCFKHCETKNKCGPIPCYTYKSRFHLVICLCMCAIALTLLFATIVPLVFHHLELEGIKEEVVIDSKSASSYDTWQSNYYGKGKKRMISYQIFIFNVQNPVEALAGEKPIVVQQGPYAFNQYFNKFDIHWSDDGDTVQYRLQTFYVFDQANSGPGLMDTDNVTLAYPSALGFEYLLGQIPIDAQELLDAAVETRINTKLDSIDAALDAAIKAVERNPLLSPEEKNATLAQLHALEDLVTVVRTGLIEYVEEAPAGTSLLKLILCTSLPAGNGVSLFYQTNPVNACESPPRPPLSLPSLHAPVPPLPARYILSPLPLLARLSLSHPHFCFCRLRLRKRSSQD
jgi:hypothetical protein